MEGLFCLLFLILIVALLVSALEQPTPADTAKQTIDRIGQEADRHMEELTAQYRKDVDKQTRRYR